jgi:heme-degrading monooxygenase HmoA
MYGTVARFRAKAGMEEKLIAFTKAEEMDKIPGLIGTNVYRMDNDANEYYLTVVFESKDAYVKNAESPEQDARYREFLTFLEGEPEWHDGEIIYSS